MKQAASGPDRHVVYRFENFELDPTAQLLRADGKPVKLDPKPLALLTHLVRNREREVPRDEVIEAVWPDVTVSDAAVASVVRDARRVLRDDGARQRIIRTIRGTGFRFAAPVQEIAGAAEALRSCREAGALALRRFDYGEAVAHFRRARGLLVEAGAEKTERLAVLLDLGDAEGRNGDNEPARETYREACDLARRLADWESFGWAALGFAIGEETGAPNPERVSLLKEALEHVPDESPLRVRLLGRLGYALWFGEPRQRARDLLGDAIDLARRTDDIETLYGVLGRAHWVMVGPGRLPARREISDELIRLSDQVEDPMLVACSRVAAVWDALAGCELAIFERQVAQLEREALELRAPIVDWWAGVMRAARAFLRGRFEEAEAISAEALEIGRRTGDVWHEATHFILTEKIRAYQGRMPEMEPILRHFASVLPEQRTFGIAVLYCEVLRGERDGGMVELRRHVASDFAELRDDVNWYNLAHFLVLICEALEAVDDAGPLYDLLLPLADEAFVVAPGWLYLGSIHRWLGTLASVRGDWDAAQQHFELGLERDRRMGAVVCRAEGLVQYARMQHARGEPAAARAPLAQGLELARAMGLARIEAQALALRQ